MSDDYEVGYGKPPTHRQFKKGQSGNKKGRPKGSKNVATILKEALSKKVIVRDGDKVRRISKGEAFVETVLNDSLKGDNQARRVFVSMARLTGQLDILLRTRGGSAAYSTWAQAFAGRSRKTRGQSTQVPRGAST